MFGTPPVMSLPLNRALQWDFLDPDASARGGLNPLFEHGLNVS